MNLWSEVSESELSSVKGICLDIDDTLSTNGKLTAKAFSALWSLKEHGYAVVPITGRPAGWCDHIARFWPVDAVIGENGAFSFWMGKSGRRERYNTLSNFSPKEAEDKIEQLKTEILKNYPNAKWASDQSYREYDLAIDFCEDVDRWPAADVDALVALCKNIGAEVKISSIHVNAWFGKYDKISGFNAWIKNGLSDCASISKKDLLDQKNWIFIGDSPNDEPLFAAFDMSVGVSNLTPFLDRIQSPPKWITNGESGNGFVEFAEKLLKNPV